MVPDRLSLSQQNNSFKGSSGVQKPLDTNVKRSTRILRRAAGSFLAVLEMVTVVAMSAVGVAMVMTSIFHEFYRIPRNALQDG
jgi:hypothetical protein